MAYSRGPTTALKSSASLVPGNLEVLIGLEGDSSLTYVVTHKGCANIVHTSSGVCTQEQVTFDATGDKDPASHLIQVSLFTVRFSIFACSGCKQGVLYLEAKRWVGLSHSNVLCLVTAAMRNFWLVEQFINSV